MLTRSLTALAVVATAATPALSRASLAAHNPTVVIHRDTDTGVPHILGDNDQAAFFGLGYVCANDRLFQMHLLRQSATGELTDLIGYRIKPSALDKIACGSTLDPFDESTVVSDRFYRSIGLYDYAEDLVTNGDLDDYTMSALQSYADGVNEYIDSLGPAGSWDTAGKHPHFNGVRPPDWLPQDSLAVWNYLGSFSFQGSWKSGEISLYKTFQQALDNMLSVDDAVNTALGIPLGAALPQLIYDDDGFMVEFSDYGDIATGSTYPQSTLESDIVDFYNANLPYKGQAITALSTACLTFPRAGFSARKSSHSWAVSGQRSDSGAAIVHGDSRNFVGAPSLFYEYRIRGLGFDARGAGFPGTPGLFAFGFNENVAWSGSGAGLDMRDSMVLQNVSGSSFDWDGGTGTITTTSESITYDDNGTQMTETFDVRRAQDAQGNDLGPVVTDIVKSPGSYEYVLRSPDLFFKRHTVQSSLRMMHAYDARDFREKLKGWITPNLYVVFGDNGGNVGAAYAASVPARKPGAPLAGMMAQPISGPADDWQGWVPYDITPWTVKDTGVVITSNQAGAGCWYPNYLGQQSRGDNERSLRISELLDPSGTSTFTRQQMTDMARDAEAPSSRELVEWAIEIRDQPGGYPAAPSLWGIPQLNAGKDLVNVLEGWLTGTDTTSSPACSKSGNGPDLNVDEPYARGAAGLASPRIGKIMSGSMTIFDPVVLPQTYGLGGEGANRLIEDLSERTTALDSADPLDAEIIEWIAMQFYIASVRASCTDPCIKVVPLSCPSPSTTIDACGWEAEYAATVGTRTIVNMITFAGFGSLKDLAGAPTDDVITSIENGETVTIYSLNGRSYAQTVDLADLDDAVAIQPIGNQESPDTGPYYDSNVADYAAGNLLAAPLQPGLEPPATYPANYTVESSNSYSVDRGHYGVGTPYSIEDPVTHLVDGPLYPTITGGTQTQGDTAYTLTLSGAPANRCVILYAGDASLSSTYASILRGARLWNNQKHTRDFGWTFTGETDANGELTMTLHDFKHPQTGDSLIDILQTGDDIYYQFLVYASDLPAGQTCGNHTANPDLLATNGLWVEIQ